MPGHHLVQQHRPDLRSDNTLHVVTSITNTSRWHSRYRLAREFMERMEGTPNVALYVVEGAFGDRHHEVTDSSNPRHLQLRIHSEIWVKENLINLGVRYLLPRDWRYMAWVDGDVEFRDPHWAQETMHQLQHFPVLQPWQQCADLGPLGDVMQAHTSMGYLNQKGERIQRHSAEPYRYGHSGFAWACRRDFWEAVGGLMDFCVLGSGDHHMGWATIGDVDSTIHQKMLPSFFARCRDWQRRALMVSHKEIGFVNGRIEHHFHGSKTKRQYRERWQILIDHKFDPDKHLMYDEDGLVQLVGKPELEKEIRKYNRDRSEDSIDP